jgi:hypothetical protein
LCQPLAPAVLCVLQQVITACNQANKPVTLCGEMAGQPKAFLLLLGMGLRRFSMSPAFIPSIKQLASIVSLEEARHIADTALAFTTTKQVQMFDPPTRAPGGGPGDFGRRNNDGFVSGKSRACPQPTNLIYLDGNNPH